MQVQIGRFPILQAIAALLNKQKLTSAHSLILAWDKEIYSTLQEEHLNIYYFIDPSWLQRREKKKKANWTLENSFVGETLAVNNISKTVQGWIKCFINNKYFSDFHSKNFIEWLFDIIYFQSAEIPLSATISKNTNDQEFPYQAEVIFKLSHQLYFL